MLLLLGSSVLISPVGLLAQKSQLEKSIESLILKSGVSKAHLGLIIRHDLGPDNTPLVELNKKKKFIPASLTKILPAVTALGVFPQDHEFKTQIYVKKNSIKLEKYKTVTGPLYLKGDGDPYFTSEFMWRLVNEFIRTKIEWVKGNVIVDDSKFDLLRYDPGREPTRIDRAYDSPIGAMSFNWNTVNVYVRPSGRVGSPAEVFADPKSNYIVVENRAKTTKQGTRKNIKISRVSIKGKNKDKIIVSGNIPLNYKEIVSYKSIHHPDFWSGEQFKSFLNQRGVRVSGSVSKGVVPSDAVLLTELAGEPLHQSITGMMKFSNNYIAEMLTKNLAAYSGEKPATMSGGLEVIRQYLLKLGIKKSDYKLVNPSGLTRKNLFSPMVFDKVLTQVSTNFKIFPEYLSSLPISGIDGSLKKRMSDNNTKGWVRAKTGTLRGVTGLAGFAGQKSGKVFQFVFLYNGPEAKKQKVMDLFDNISRTLVRGR